MIAFLQSRLQITTIPDETHVASNNFFLYYNCSLRFMKYIKNLHIFSSYVLMQVWNPPPHLKISADQLQLAWTESVAKMFNVSHPTLEQFLSAFFLTLYTDIRSVAKARKRHSSLPEEVTRIGRLIGASFLERRKLKVRICDENGADVPHELLAHSALTFPGVTFSSPGADSNEVRAICHS